MSKIYEDLRSSERFVRSVDSVSTLTPVNTADPVGPLERVNPISPVYPAELLVTTIPAGLRIKGLISANEDALVDGIVEGPIYLGSGKLTVGTGGKIVGDVVAGEIAVQGSIEGNLLALDGVEIDMAGSVCGDVKTSRIVIQDGAHFQGSIETNLHRLESVSSIERPSQAFAASAARAGNRSA